MADRQATIGSGKNYASSSAAEAAQRALYANLVGNGDTMTFLPQEDFADANALSTGAWTVDATHFLTWNIVKAYRHTGKRATGYRIIVNAGGSAVT